MTLVICLCVFPALQAWFVSDEEYARLNELAHEQTSEMNQQLAKTLGRFIVGQDEPDEKYEEFLKSQGTDVR